MCLAVVALDAHPRYAVVVAANRDEYHARPTAPAAWWPEGILAGRDLQAGGTWLGVTRQGRFALLTNVRDPARNDASAPSRGSLVPRVLDAAEPVLQALDGARREGVRHNGFNLLAGERGEVGWTSNRAAGVRALAPGIYGLSNASLDVAWPKVARTREAIARWIGDRRDELEPLFDALADRTLAQDAELPSTGVTLDWERALSASFIMTPRYGTRSSTVLAIDRDASVRFIERSFAPDGTVTGEVDERFVLER